MPRLRETSSTHDLKDIRESLDAPLSPDVSEGIKHERRYLLIVRSAQKNLAGTAFTKDKAWTKHDIEKIKDFYLEAATYAHPNLLSNFASHILLTGIYARKIAEKLSTPLLSPIEAEGLGLWHDVGTLVDPTAYLKKDLIGGRISARAGVDIKQSELEKLPDVPRSLGLGGTPINSFNDETISQRILNVSDNLGKFNDNGTLFTIEQMMAYASRQLNHYPADLGLPSTTAGIKALKAGKQELGIKIVQDEIRWLQEQGIDFTALREEVTREIALPANKKWILAFQDAQQSLDRRIDEKLGREPIKTILFDVGNVLLTADDSLFIQKVAQSIGCSIDMVRSFLEKTTDQAMIGKIGQIEYLQRFYDEIKKNTPAREFPMPTIEEARRIFHHPNIYSPIEGMQDLVYQLLKNPQVQVFFHSDLTPSVKEVVTQKLKEFYPEIPSDRIFLSCDMKASKRQKDSTAYDEIIKKTGVHNPENMVAIDDNVNYVDFASKKRIRRHHFRPGADNISVSARLHRELSAAGIF